MYRKIKSPYDPLSCVKSRKKLLDQQELFCDIGLMSHLSEELKGKENEVMQEGVFGFFGYLSPTFNPNLPHIKSKSFLRHFFQTLQSGQLNTAVGIFCEQAELKDIATASPYRLKPITHRLEQDLQIDPSIFNKDSYADGDLSWKIDTLCQIKSKQSSLNLRKDAHRNDSSDVLADEIKKIGHKKNLEENFPGDQLMTKDSGPVNDSLRQAAGAENSIAKQDYSQEEQFSQSTPNARKLRRKTFQSQNKNLFESLTSLELLSFTSYDDSSNSMYSTVLKSDKQDKISSPRIPLASNTLNLSSLQLGSTDSQKLSSSESPNEFGKFRTRLPETNFGQILLVQDDFTIPQGLDETSATAKRIKLLSRENSLTKTEKLKSPVPCYNLRKLSKEQVIEELKSPIVIRLDFKRAQNDRDKLMASKNPRKVQSRSRIPNLCSTVDEDNGNTPVWANLQGKKELQKPMKETPGSNAQPDRKLMLPVRLEKSKLLERRSNFDQDVKIITKRGVIQPSELSKIRYNYDYFKASRPSIWQQKAALSLLETLKGVSKNSLFNVALLNVSCAKLISQLNHRNSSDSEQTKRIFIGITSPHLMFSSDKIPPSESSLYKFGQPIGDRKNRKHLIYHFKIHGVDLMTSGHCFVPPQYKKVEDGCLIKSLNGTQFISESNFKGICTAGFGFQVI